MVLIQTKIYYEICKLDYDMATFKDTKIHFIYNEPDKIDLLKNDQIPEDITSVKLDNNDYSHENKTMFILTLI